LPEAAQLAPAAPLPHYNTTQQFLDQQCDNQWNLVATGQFGAVYRCYQDALKMQKVTNDNTLGLQAAENAFPQLVLDQCDRDRRACGVAPTLNELQVVEVSQSPYTVSRMPMYETSGYHFLTHPRDAADWRIPDILDNFKLLANAVLEIHDLGFLHRDIKPPNILVNIQQFGRYRMALADFGLICRQSADVQRLPDTPLCSAQVTGTGMYMDPAAILEGGTWDDPSIDVYALGLTMFEMILGRHWCPKELRDALGHCAFRGDCQGAVNLRARLDQNYVLTRSALFYSHEQMQRLVRDRPMMSQRNLHRWNQAMNDVHRMMSPFNRAERPTAREIVEHLQA
jgi:serine/threonine protein kinase